MLRVRFSDEEWASLEGLAHSADITMSELVRNHLGKVTIRNRKDEQKRTAMLNRINANLNMIARWVNTYRANAEPIEVVAHLMAIEREIKELAE